MTPATARRAAQRRIAIAALVLIAVVAAVGIGVFALGGGGKPPTEVAEVTAGQQALESAQEAVRLVYENGSNLVTDDPTKAMQLLTNAYEDLKKAAAAGIPTSAIAPLQSKVVGGLDTLYGVVEVGATQAFSFEKADPPVELTQILQGPDGAPYVLDGKGGAVYRVDLAGKKATLVLAAGTEIGKATAGTPRFISSSGPDLLILDAKNILWRFRPIDKKGNGTLARVSVADSTTWGKDVSAMDTFLRDVDRGLYNLYIVDPSSKQILRYSPAADGSGFPANASDYLAAPQDVSGISSLYIDGALWAIDGTDVARFSGGQRSRNAVADPGDEILRPGTAYGLVTGYGGSSDGTVYAWDRANRRIIATDKATGGFIAQYRLAEEPERWDAVTGMYVVDRGESKPPLLYWTDATRIWSTPLDAGGAPGTTPGASGASGGSPGASSSAAPSDSPAGPSVAPAESIVSP